MTIHVGAFKRQPVSHPVSQPASQPVNVVKCVSKKFKGSLVVVFIKTHTNLPTYTNMVVIGTHTHVVVIVASGIYRIYVLYGNR